MRGTFIPRVFAAVIDLMILAVPLAVFISFLSVALGISSAFLDLRPGEVPKDVLVAFGGRFIYSSLAFFVVTSWVYFAGFESSKWRATPGKRLLGLTVADEAGNRVSFGRASGRFGFGRLMAHVPYVGIYYFLGDCLWVGFSKRQEAVHDLMSGCRVRREVRGLH
jgi:uncharacterized RDD family membrane protein YckC